MRLEPIRDRAGDIVAERESRERLLERGDSPLTHLDIGPQNPCSECGHVARETEPGRWLCRCDYPTPYDLIPIADRDYLRKRLEEDR